MPFRNVSQRRFGIALLATLVLALCCTACGLLRKVSLPDPNTASPGALAVRAESDPTNGAYPGPATPLFVPFALAQCTPTPTATVTQTPLPPTATPTATPWPPGYYVDSVSGSDTNAGSSADAPWQTLDNLRGQDLQPGDVVYLKAGSSWSGTLRISHSGSEGHPIVYRPYGEGPRPMISGTGRRSDTCIDVKADWVVIEGLEIQNSPYSGIRLAEGSDHNTVRDCEISDVGLGVAVHGQHNLVTANNIHDLNMVVDTRGGDDDYGAVGVWLFASDNEVSHNRFQACRGHSYDYGSDGGAVESYGAVSNSYVHHNWAQDCEGFFEIGGSDDAGREVRNTRVAYNVLIDVKRALHFNLGDYQYSVDVDGFVFEHNTVLESSAFETAFFFVQGELVGDQLTVRNNILSGFSRLSQSTGFIHQYNLYHGTWVPFGLGEGEFMANPEFVAKSALNLTLQDTSPAIDQGIDLGYARDYAGNSVPYGERPDLGAYEYVPGD